MYRSDRWLPRYLGWLLAAVALVAALAACERSGEDTALPTRIYVLGLDALSGAMVDDYVAEGRLPNFARILREGSHAPLQAPDPLAPTQLWTTALTGKRPETHEVVGEFVRLPNSGRVARRPSSARNTQSLLQIVGTQGHTVLSVGIPGTWPAEVVNGITVSNGYRPHRWTRTSEHNFDIAKTGLTYYPPTVGSEISDLIEGVDRVSREDVARFFTFNESEYQELYDQPLGSFRLQENPPRDFALTLQADRSNLAVAARLSQRYHSRLVVTDLELASAVEPAYWYYTRPEIYRPSSDSQRRLGRAVVETYSWIDERVGEILQQLPPGSTLVLVAPSGFGDGERTEADGEIRPVPTHNAEGHLWMWGRGIARGVEGSGGRLEDLTPTVLALLGLDVGSDMDGNVLRALLDPDFLAAHPVTTGESYDLDWDSSHRYPEKESRDSRNGTSVAGPGDAADGAAPEGSEGP